MKDNPFQPATKYVATPAPAGGPPPPVVTITTIALAKPGTYGKGRFVVRSVDVRTSPRGSFLQLGLGDKVGEVSAVCWKGAPLAEKLRIGTVVEIDRFLVDDYGPKFELGDLRMLGPGEYRVDEFVASLPVTDIEKNWAEFHEFLDSIRNPHLQKLRERIWGDRATAEKYKTHTSAVGHHHNYIGGNVQHVVGIMRVVEAVCTSYPKIDRDLVIFGAAVHDLGKLREYEVGAAIRVTEEGKLKGHLVIGAEWIGQLVAQMRAEGYDFPKTLEDEVVHMILSHHGKGEWGSPKPPATVEAMLLHLGDYADSQTKKFLQDVESNAANAEGWVKHFDRDIGESRWVRTRREESR